MKVLVIGSGAREHAIVHSLRSDPAVTAIVSAPGNAGIAEDVPTRPVDATDPAAVADLAVAEGADLVVVGPEAPLVAGVADAVRAAGIDCFGPSAAAARLESSKSFAKEVMHSAGVPTAAARTCTDIDLVAAALDEFGAPYVVKDDGLAAGKGVVVTEDRDEALAHARSCLGKGGSLVVEEYLDGPEVSLFVITDGKSALALQPAQDFKRVGDGDSGPNTGGMGAYSPLPWADRHLVDQIMEQVARPTIAEMARRGTPFAGVLYCGLALTSKGLRVVEFNCRFGDPEIQAVLALLESPLSPILAAAARGELASVDEPVFADAAAVNVVIAAHGYPEDPRTGDPIEGVHLAGVAPEVHVLHAGTATDDDGRLVTSGGRVLSVVAVGDDVADAREHAYRGAGLIRIPGSHHRTDIADPARWPA